MPLANPGLNLEVDSSSYYLRGHGITGFAVPAESKVVRSDSALISPD